MRKTTLVLAVLLSLAVTFTVQSASKPTGKLKVATPGVVLELKMADKPVPIPNGRTIPLPADTYQPAAITCHGRLPKGKQIEMWSIKSTGPFGTLKDISVTDGQLTEINCGAPFVLKASVSQSTSNGAKVVSVGLSVVGKAGETYAIASLRRGQSTVPPPSLRIVDEKGNALTQGKFEYG